MNELQDVLNDIESLERDESIFGCAEGKELVRNSINEVKRKLSETVISLNSKKERFVLKNDGDTLLIRGPYRCGLTIEAHQEYSNVARDFTMKVRFWESDEMSMEKPKQQGASDWFPRTTAEKKILWNSPDYESVASEDEVASIIASRYAEKSSAGFLKGVEAPSSFLRRNCQ